MSILEPLVGVVFLATFAFLILRRRQRKPPLREAEMTKPEWWGADLTPPGLRKTQLPPREDDDEN